MISTDNKIWVKKEFGREKTAGGLFIAEDEQMGGIRDGYVVKVGPGRLNPYNGERVPCCCKVGDHIVFNSGTGATCLIVLTNKETNKQESYFVMNDNEVIGILDDKKEALTVYGDGSIPEDKPASQTELILQAQKAKSTGIITNQFGV